jgi:hypothetical protein
MFNNNSLQILETTSRSYKTKYKHINFLASMLCKHTAVEMHMTSIVITNTERHNAHKCFKSGWKSFACIWKRVKKIQIMCGCHKWMASYCKNAATTDMQHLKVSQMSDLAITHIEWLTRPALSR